MTNKIASRLIVPTRSNISLNRFRPLPLKRTTTNIERDSNKVREHGVSGGGAPRGVGARPREQVEEVHARTVRATGCEKAREREIETAAVYVVHTETANIGSLCSDIALKTPALCHTHRLSARVSCGRDSFRWILPAYNAKEDESITSKRFTTPPPVQPPPPAVLQPTHRCLRPAFRPMFALCPPFSLIRSLPVVSLFPPSC